MADIVQVAANVRFSANARLDQKFAGESIVMGQPVYYDANAGGVVKKCTANAAASGQPRGVAASTADLGQPVLVCLQDPDFTPGFNTVAATPYFNSVTAGSFADARVIAGKFGAFMGVGKAGNKMNLEPVFCPDAAA